MVLLGGLELVAAGYILNEINKDDKAKEEEREQRERERRRRRRRRHSHSRHDDHYHGYEHQAVAPPPPHAAPAQGLRPYQNFNGPLRPSSAPPLSTRPPMQQLGPAWQQPGRPPPHPAPQSHGTWPGHPQAAPPPFPQSQGRPPAPGANAFVPGPVPRPAMSTMYPPPGTHLDLKTGKLQSNMYPPQMMGAQNPRHRTGSYERRRESGPARPGAGVYPQPGHAQSQPQIRVSAPAVSTPPPRQGYAELDAETPGRYRPRQGHEKTGYPNHDHDDDDVGMQDPPPAYRE